MKFLAKLTIRISEWIGAFRVLTIVQADNRREFKRVLKLLQIAYGIKIINRKPKILKTQGLVEQANTIVKEKILV
jgi:hypothetical protein